MVTVPVNAGNNLLQGHARFYVRIFHDSTLPEIRLDLFTGLADCKCTFLNKKIG